MSTDRRQLIAAAGLRVVAAGGLRSLTHRAVDAEASMPTGSSSYYFRSREALVAACVERLVAIDLEELAAVGLTERQMAVAELGALGAGLMWRWLHEDAHRHLARFELLLESRRRPHLRTELVRAGEQLRASMAALLTAQGAPDAAERARWFVACIDGMVFDQLVGVGAATPLTYDELLAWATGIVTLVLAPR
jgi:DNA-binding transcriptional regulator YbjK